MFGVVSADPAPGPELVLRAVPVTGSLSGLASTKAWVQRVGGGPPAVQQFAGIGRNSVSIWGEPTACSGAHPSVLWSAQGAGPSAPSLLLLLTHVAQGEYQQMWGQKQQHGFLLLRAQCTVQVSLLPHLLSPRHSRSPGMPPSAALMSPGRTACWGTPSLPVARPF